MENLKNIDNTTNLKSLKSLDTTELESINGGVAPLLIFIGKAALSGVGFGLGYFGAKKILG